MSKETSSERVVFDKPSLPSINVQNPTTAEDTYYGRFRSIVKQRFFGLKLEESPFMEFIDSNPDMKERLGEFSVFMDNLKDEYTSFLKKNYPDKIEKRKKKRKGKKKDSGNILEVPKLDSDFYSSDNSGIFSTSRDELDITNTNELTMLRSKIESIRNHFTFDSIENVAKNIHLFDDFFGKIKAEHTNRQQMDQLKQFQLLSFGVGQSEGGISFASLGNAAGNNQSKGQVDDLPPCFDYFHELYRRWDSACDELGIDKQDEVYE